jgi:hypothetical protein
MFVAWGWWRRDSLVKFWQKFKATLETKIGLESERDEEHHNHRSGGLSDDVPQSGA